jgi:hypothetical protein
MAEVAGGGWAEQLAALTETHVETVVLGGALGAVAAVLLHWVVWPYVLGWRGVDEGSSGKRRLWTPLQFVVASTILGAWFAGAMGVLGVVLFLWGLGMWGFNRTARLGNSGW